MCALLMFLRSPTCACKAYSDVGLSAGSSNPSQMNIWHRHLFVTVGAQLLWVAVQSSRNPFLGHCVALCARVQTHTHTHTHTRTRTRTHTRTRTRTRTVRMRNSHLTSA